MTPFADSVVAQLLFLDAEDADKDIQLYINSPVVPFMQGWRFTTPCNRFVPMW